MASTNRNISTIEEKINKLDLSVEQKTKDQDETNTTNIFEPHLSGFETRELYKIALNFYKGKTLSALDTFDILPASFFYIKLFSSSFIHLKIHL